MQLSPGLCDLFIAFARCSTFQMQSSMHTANVSFIGMLQSAGSCRSFGSMFQLQQQLTNETAVSNDQPDFPSTAILVRRVEAWCQKWPLQISSPTCQDKVDLSVLSQLVGTDPTARLLEGRVVHGRSAIEAGSTVCLTPASQAGSSSDSWLRRSLRSGPTTGGAASEHRA